MEEKKQSSGKTTKEVLILSLGLMGIQGDFCLWGLLMLVYHAVLECGILMWCLILIKQIVIPQGSGSASTYITIIRIS
jgi:hypothetical protein